ncbi:MAG: hypothetical protein JSW38_09815 [Dehalococcoidia bacterium]|nr:MAG: hypothetical protein JSW38_09815 [Dehalococcoidia bacterium]
MTAISALLIITAIGTVLYWVDFFTRGEVQTIKEDWYIKFEKAFPAADLWMSACAVAGAAGLLMDKSYGPVFALLTAGSLIFLALMDITFSTQNGLYRLVRSSNQMRFEVFINIWTLGFGIAVITYISPKIAPLI